jgi:hypothetical protein
MAVVAAMATRVMFLEVGIRPVRVQSLEQLRRTRLITGEDVLCTFLEVSVEWETIDDDVRHGSN